MDYVFFLAARLAAIAGGPQGQVQELGEIQQALGDMCCAVGDVHCTVGAMPCPSLLPAATGAATVLALVQCPFEKS